MLVTLLGAAISGEVLHGSDAITGDSATAKRRWLARTVMTASSPVSRPGCA